MLSVPEPESSEPGFPEHRFQRKCSLELLPTELRIDILYSCSDLAALSSLVHASPIYHGTYQRIRKDCLLKILHAEYDGVVDIVDALVAVRSRDLQADQKSNKDKIYSLLDQWRRHEEIRRLDLPSARDLPDKPADLNETCQLINLHKIMKFCFNDFCNTVKCPKWITPAQWKADVSSTNLSCTERARIYRGLYRLQIYSNIFGRKEMRPNDEMCFEDNDMYCWKIPEEEAALVFSGLLTPWEFQELCCVWQFIFERYTETYIKVAKFFEEEIRFQPPFTNCMPMDFISADQLDRPLPRNHCVTDTSDLWYNGVQRHQALATMGPAFFYKFIRKDDFLDRRDLILVNAALTVEGFLYMNIGNMGHPITLLYPADSLVPYTNWNLTKAYWATLKPTQRPNIACDRLWFPDPTDDEWTKGDAYHDWLACWEWGYAIWDDERLIKWQVPLDEITTQRYDHWTPYPDAPSYESWL